MGAFIDVYSKRTGRKQRIPEHWLTIASLAAPFRKTPTQRRDEGELDLKGKGLDEALELAGLPKTGTADEKRAAIAEHLADAMVTPDVDDTVTPDVDAPETAPAETTEPPHVGDQEKE